MQAMTIAGSLRKPFRASSPLSTPVTYSARMISTATTSTRSASVTNRTMATVKMAKSVSCGCVRPKSIWGGLSQAPHQAGSVWEAGRMLAVPPQSRADHGLQIVARFPQLVANAIVGSELGCRLTLARCALRRGKAHAGNALHRLDDLFRGVTATQPHVIGRGLMPSGQRLERQHMGRREIEDVDVVADGRAVGRVDLGAGELESLPAERAHDGVGKQMRFGVVMFAD